MPTKTIQRKNFNIDYTIVLGYITSSNGNEWRVKQKDITKKRGDFIVYEWNIVRMKDGLVLSNAGLPRDVSAYDFIQNKELIKDLIDKKENKQINGSMKLKKGSKQAKDFMAKVRASKGKKSLGAVKKKKTAVKRKPLATESKSLKDTLKRKKLSLPHGYELRKRKLSGVSKHKDVKSHNYRISISGKKSKLFGIPSDRDAIREIEIYAENDPQLYYSRTLPILKNLAKKYVKGTFDVNKSAKLWQYYVEDAMKKYHKQYGGSGSWSKLLSVPDRKTLAKELAEATLDNFENGDYKDYI